MVEDDTLPAPDGAGTPTCDGKPNRSLFRATPSAEQLAERTADRIISDLVAFLWDEPERIRQKFADCVTDAVDDGVPKTMHAFKKPAKQIEEFIAKLDAEWKSPEFRSALTTILRNRIEGRTTPFDAPATLLRHPFSPYTVATLQTMGKIDPFAVAESEIPQIPLKELRAGLGDLYRQKRDAERAALVSAAVSAHPDAAVDDSAFVAAKTLYQHRGMTAAKCNKFLKRFGTESTEPIEGKIRNRPKGGNRREIHSGDWHKFWEYVDRRQFEFINEDAIEAFLANVEAEKSKVKSAKKLGGANSQKVSKLTKILR